MPAIVIPAPINSNHVAPVAAGGTGANTAANARTNLDVYSKSEVTSAIAQSTAPVEFTLTSADSNKFVVVDSACYKIGNVAVVNLSFNVLTSPASTETMFTGFPTPKKDVIVSCGKSGSVAVVTGNKLRNNWDTFNANTRYYLNIAYATA